MPLEPTDLASIREALAAELAPLQAQLASLREQLAQLEAKISLLPDLRFLHASATAQEVVQALRANASRSAPHHDFGPIPGAPGRRRRDADLGPQRRS